MRRRRPASGPLKLPSRARSAIDPGAAIGGVCSRLLPAAGASDPARRGRPVGSGRLVGPPAGACGGRAVIVQVELGEARPRPPATGAGAPRRAAAPRASRAARRTGAPDGGRRCPRAASRRRAGGGPLASSRAGGAELAAQPPQQRRRARPARASRRPRAAPAPLVEAAAQLLGASCSRGSADTAASGT